MITQIEYALMAGASYITTRRLMNRFPVPSGWTPFFPVPDTTTASVFTATNGFEARSFINGTNIVISFAGTYDNPLNPLTNPDLQADIGLARFWLCPADAGRGLLLTSQGSQPECNHHLDRPQLGRRSCGIGRRKINGVRLH